MKDKVIQLLTYGPTAAHAPTWTDTSYVSLAEARKLNPNDPPNFFRIKRDDSVLADTKPDKHAGLIRGFIHLNEAWYADTCKVNYPRTIDDVMIGLYDPDGVGGTTREFRVEWVDLSSSARKRDITPRLTMFDDSWKLLSLWPDFWAEMVKEDSKDIPPEAFCRMLLELGFKDLTPRVNPYA